MLDGSNIGDIKEIFKYGKARGYLTAKRYKMPVYPHFYIIENEKEIEQLLSKFENQDGFYMRSDTEIGNIPIGVKGKNGDRDTIYDYMREIKEKSEKLKTKGVSIIYWNDGKFCNTYDVDGNFYLDYRTKKDLIIDYVGKGWDGAHLSHGTACHETYVIPWEDILFLTDSNRKKYRRNIISEYGYNDLREARIMELEKNYNIPTEKGKRLIPEKYSGINNEHFRQVIDQVIIPMYDKPELQREYKEYIPIAQIENGKVLVPEIILPTRLKYIEMEKESEER